MDRNRITKAQLGSSLLPIAALTCLAAQPAMGQESEPAPAAVSEVDAQDIIVTGSRIGRDAIDSATLVTILSAEAIENQGITNVTDLLRQLPAASTLSSGRTVALSNFSTVDLRALGPTRTLVLVDGKRFVPGIPGTTTVDLNAIPADFIERVDIVTGGASAVYGSEAVAGVVNIILKEDIEGVQIRAQGGISSRGDNKSYSIGATFGGRFADDRGSASIHFGYAKDGVVESKDRGFSSIDTTSNGLGVNISPAFSSIGSDGRFIINGTSYNPDGSVFVTREDGYNRNQDAYLAFPQERFLLAAKLRYDLTDDVRFKLDATYYHNENTSRSAPTAFGDGVVFIGLGRGAPSNSLPVDNPFIPDALRELIPPGTTSIRFVRRATELGQRFYENRVQGFNISPSLSGSLGGDWKWNAYYTFGRTTQDFRLTGQFNPAALQEALTVVPDGNGGYRCASATARLAGCVPYNPFGFGSPSEAALDYIRADSTAHADLTQHATAATITGSLFELPAGAVKVAAGIEYRKLHSDRTPDALTQAGLNSAGPNPRQVGGYDVKEAFAEIEVPLIHDTPFIEALTLEAAYRIADYSTIGSKGAYKVGLVYQPYSDLRLRAVYATATRAPNIVELFSPPQTIFPVIADPCAGGGVTTGLDPAVAATRTKNCLATPGITTNFFPTQLDLTTVIGSTGGNPDLEPETAKTLTLGAVFTPGFLPGATLTVDYYRIRIKDAIQTLAPSVAAAQCVNQLTYPDNIFCNAILRDPVTGNIRRIDQLQSNIAGRSVSGIDVEANYAFRIGAAARLSFNLLYSHLLEDKQSAFPGATPINFAGSVGYAKDRFVLRTSLELGRFHASHVLRLIGPANRAIGVTFDGNRVPAFVYNDLQLAYDVTDEAQAYVGAVNLFDKKPPLIPTPYPGSVSGSETVPSVYDVIGLSLYAGVKFKF